MNTSPLPNDRSEQLDSIDRYWRACNYVAAAMMFLRENVLLREPLRFEHVKPRILGHWGSSPGLSFVWTHMNRVIRRDDRSMLFIAGPGHGAPGVIAPTYLEGRLGEVYPEFSADEAGLRMLCRRFSAPGAFGSHCTPEIPGSIHEGGELGYSLSHAFGAAFDNPRTIVTCVIGDGEAETGALATSWHSNKFLHPGRDGTVLPILHLNGYKIANPTILDRIPKHELLSLLQGYGWAPTLVDAHEPATAHEAFAAAIDSALEAIDEIRAPHRWPTSARAEWPMIVLRTPKGWTGPSLVDGHRVEGSWRAHQVPLPLANTDPTQLAQLEDWLRSYRPDELFGAEGRLTHELVCIAPSGRQRMSANRLTSAEVEPLVRPDDDRHSIAVPRAGELSCSNTEPLGAYLADLIARNPTTFRLFGPDETASNRLDDVYRVTGKAWQADVVASDGDGAHLDPTGRVMEMLSEHTLEGWLEGYLLTGRHGLLHTYESFAPIITSMVGQHAKWLEVSASRAPWRPRPASLNLLLTSTVWRQDHNGFSHQDPGFISLLTNRSPDVCRLYFPPDANCVLAVADHCFQTRGTINVIVADKHSHLQYLDGAAARLHVAAGVGRWDWASQNDRDLTDPDVVMVGCGDVSTQEALAATAMLRSEFAELSIRFVNVVDLFRIRSSIEHPHGLGDAAFADLFGSECPVVFNFHGYSGFLRELLWGRPHAERFSLHGYREHGSIDTPLELAIVNRTDRYRLALDALTRLRERGRFSAAELPRVENLEVDLHARLDAAVRSALDNGVDSAVDSSWTWPNVAFADREAALSLS